MVINRVTKQSEIQNAFKSLSDELLKDLGGTETLREAAIIDLINPSQNARDTLSQTVAGNLREVANNISTYFDRRGKQIKQIDLDGDGSTTDDVKALARIVNQKSTVMKDNSVAITKAEADLKTAQDLLAALPPGEALDRVAMKTKKKLQTTIKKLDSQIVNLGGLSVVQKQEKANLVALGATGQDLATYTALVKNKVGAETVKMYTDAFKGSVGLLSGHIRHSALRDAFNGLTQREATADKYVILKDLALNGVDGVDGQEYSGEAADGRFTNIVSWYSTILARKDLNAASIKSIMKIKYDGEDGKISTGAWDGIAPLWSNNASDAKFKEYADYVVANPNRSAAEYIAFAESVVARA